MECASRTTTLDFAKGKNNQLPSLRAAALALVQGVAQCEGGNAFSLVLSKTS